MGSCIYMPGAEDIKAMQARHDELERLYFLDGRDKPEHPYYSCYTGLFITANTTNREHQ